MAFFSCCILHNMLLKDQGWDMRAEDPNMWSQAPDHVPVIPLPEFEPDDDDATRDEGQIDRTYNGAADGNHPDNDQYELREDAYYELRAALIENFPRPVGRRQRGVAQISLASFA